MSLDVYLTLVGAQVEPAGSGIFVREAGQTKEISSAEWDEKYPGREPLIVIPNIDEEEGEVYWANITHNLNTMADEAGLYEYLWRPDTVGVTKASQLIESLKKGLQRLIDNPKRFKKFNPSNGWGSYEGLVEFVRDYSAACERYPEADVFASR